MSILSGLGVAAAGEVEDILLSQQRRIQAYIPQVVIEEQHVDELFITSHPVDRRANITDHSVKQVAQLTMRIGSSASGAVFDISSYQNTVSPTPTDVYNMLLLLQRNRQPFEVVTGKRTYSNMLMRRLTVVTDIESENALFVDIEFQEVILVDTVSGQSTATTSSTSLPGVFEDVPADPAATAPPINSGVKSPVDVTSSLSANDAAYTYPLVGGA